MDPTQNCQDYHLPNCLCGCYYNTTAVAKGADDAENARVFSSTDVTGNLNGHLSLSHGSMSSLCTGYGPWNNSVVEASIPSIPPIPLNGYWASETVDFETLSMTPGQFTPMSNNNPLNQSFGYMQLADRFPYGMSEYDWRMELDLSPGRSWNPPLRVLSTINAGQQDGYDRMQMIIPPTDGCTSFRHGNNHIGISSQYYRPIFPSHDVQDVPYGQILAMPYHQKPTDGGQDSAALLTVNLPMVQSAVPQKRSATNHVSSKDPSSAPRKKTSRDPKVTRAIRQNGMACMPCQAKHIMVSDVPALTRSHVLYSNCST
jgi:hypothetical protein